MPPRSTAMWRPVASTPKNLARCVPVKRIFAAARSSVDDQILDGADEILQRCMDRTQIGDEALRAPQFGPQGGAENKVRVENLARCPLRPPCSTPYRKNARRALSPSPPRKPPASKPLPGSPAANVKPRSRSVPTGATTRLPNPFANCRHLRLFRLNSAGITGRAATFVLPSASSAVCGVKEANIPHDWVARLVTPFHQPFEQGHDRRQGVQAMAWRQRLAGRGRLSRRRQHRRRRTLEGSAAQSQYPLRGGHSARLARIRCPRLNVSPKSAKPKITARRSSSSCCAT